MADIDRERLKKLIRVLSSDKDGEVIAAVKAIERQLKWANLSFHDLADMLTARIVEAIRVRVVEIDRTQRDWIEAADKMIESGKLKTAEWEFVTDMKRRFTLKPGFEPTEKQMYWFADLYKRYVGEKPQEPRGPSVPQ